MRLHYLAIVLGLSTVGACAKKQPAVQKPVPAATTPSDPQPVAGVAAPTASPAAPVAPAAPAASEAPAPGSRGPVKKGGDPQDGGE